MNSTTNNNAPTTKDRRLVTALFKDRESAEKAYNDLKARGYSDNDISLLMSDETRKKHFGTKVPASDMGNKAAEGAGIGSAIGGAAGAIVATILAVAAPIVLPGIGLIVTGPLVALLAGAGAGGVAGGLVGSLVGVGISAEKAREYESALKAGGIVVGVHPRSEEDARYIDQSWSHTPTRVM